MIKARSFVLDKVYPDSPQVGAKVIAYKTVNNITTGYILASDTINPHTKIFSIHEIEEHPDFWKELK